jgi:hypothetical protein
MAPTKIAGGNTPPTAPEPEVAAVARSLAKRFLEFFTAQINNAHTRRAYMNATRRFADWCASKDIHELTQVEPFYVAAFRARPSGQAIAAVRKTTPGGHPHAIRLAGDRTCYRD